MPTTAPKCPPPRLHPLFLPCRARRRVVIARPSAFVVRQRAGGPDHLSDRTPLSVAAADTDTATTVTNNGGRCDTAAIGTAPVFTAAPQALCVRIRAAVATMTAGDNRAPRGCPLAPLPVRQGARHSPPTTVVEALGACRLVAPPARRAFRSIHLLAVAGTARAALQACRGLCRWALPQARQEVRPISGAAPTTTARAIHRDCRGAHRLARQRPTGVRQGGAARTRRKPCGAIPQALLPAGGGRPPTRRGATTNPPSGSVHHRRLCGARLTRARPGESTSAEVRQARRTSSWC